MQQFEFNPMFPEEDFVEQTVFEENKTTEETENVFEKGKCSRQAERSTVEDLLSIIMASNKALNNKMNILIVKVEEITKLFKDKNSQTV